MENSQDLVQIFSLILTPKTNEDIKTAEKILLQVNIYL